MHEFIGGNKGNWVVNKIQRRRTLRLTYWDGIFTAFMIGLSESFAIVYGVKKGLSYEQIGVLSTFPIVMGSLAQWLVPQLVSHGFLKIGIQLAHLVQIMGLWGLSRVVDSSNYYHDLILSLSLYWMGGMVSGPLWLDWISSWLPHKSFARYLSRRNAFVSVFTLIAFLSGTIFVHFIKFENDLGFQWVFTLGLIARLISLCIVHLHHNPPPATLKNLAKGIQDVSQRRLRPILVILLFATFFKFVVAVSSPFFMPYMFKDLGYNMLTYVVVTAIPFLGRSLFLSGWGEAAKKIRPFIGLQIATFGISLSPFLWTISGQVFWIGFLELLSGLFWGGFDLCLVLIIQNYAPGSARKLLGISLAAMNIAALGGAWFGACYLQKKSGDFESVFVLSSQLRFLMAIFITLALRKMKETRVALAVYGDFLTTVLSLRPSLANLGRMIPLRRNPRA